MGVPKTARTGQVEVELERWYRQGLRPKVARAAKRGVIEPAQAAAFELAMAALVRSEGPKGQRHGR